MSLPCKIFISCTKFFNLLLTMMQSIMDLDPRALHVYLWVSFFRKKVLVILKSLNDANSLNVCPFLFMQVSPKVPTTFGIGWFPTLALRFPDIIRLSLYYICQLFFVVVCRNVSFLLLYLLLQHKFLLWLRVLCWLTDEQFVIQGVHLWSVIKAMPDWANVSWETPLYSIK